jgi:arginine deiminase
MSKTKTKPNKQKNLNHSREVLPDANLNQPLSNYYFLKELFCFIYVCICRCPQRTEEDNRSLAATGCESEYCSPGKNSKYF